MKSACPAGHSRRRRWSLRGVVEAQHPVIEKVRDPEPAGTVERHSGSGRCMTRGPASGTLVSKLGWPSTLSAAAPFDLLAAPSKRSTRWLPLSATHRRPVLSTATPVGSFIPLAAWQGSALVKSGWPNTPSATAPLLAPTGGKAQHPVVAGSTTKTVPLVGSTATPAGRSIPYGPVATVRLVKSGWPSTSVAGWLLAEAVYAGSTRPLRSSNRAGWRTAPRTSDNRHRSRDHPSVFVIAGYGGPVCG